MRKREAEMPDSFPCLRCDRDVPVFQTGLSLPLPTKIRVQHCEECSPIVDRERHEREQLRFAENLLARAGITAKLREWSLDSLPDILDAKGVPVKAQAIGWLGSVLAGGTPRNLILFGPVGTGKSGLAWSLVREACEQLHGGAFLNFRDYLWECRQRFAESAPLDRHPLTVPLLAIDDLGAERPTEFARDQLATLVEHRCQHHRPTIVTSNYDLEELGHRLGHDEAIVGQRLVSRLAEDTLQIRFTGDDRRLLQ